MSTHQERDINREKFGLCLFFTLGFALGIVFTIAVFTIAWNLP